MPSVSFEAGAYSVTWDSVDLGVTELGFQWVTEPSYVPIRPDCTGQVQVDGLWTGIRGMFIRFEGIGWTVSRWAKVIPWLYAPEGKSSYEAGILAKQAGLTKPLVITKLTGSGLGAGAVYTFPHAYPVEPVPQWFSAQRLRHLPAGFMILGALSENDYKPVYYSFSTGS